MKNFIHASSQVMSCRNIFMVADAAREPYTSGGRALRVFFTRDDECSCRTRVGSITDYMVAWAVHVVQDNKTIILVARHAAWQCGQGRGSTAVVLLA
jgi:hypothetical protein